MIEKLRKGRGPRLWSWTLGYVIFMGMSFVASMQLGLYFTLFWLWATAMVPVVIASEAGKAPGEWGLKWSAFRLSADITFLVSAVLMVFAAYIFSAKPRPAFVILALYAGWHTLAVVERAYKTYRFLKDNDGLNTRMW